MKLYLNNAALLLEAMLKFSLSLSILKSRVVYVSMQKYLCMILLLFYSLFLTTQKVIIYCHNLLPQSSGKDIHQDIESRMLISCKKHPTHRVLVDTNVCTAYAILII